MSFRPPEAIRSIIKIGAWRSIRPIIRGCMTLRLLPASEGRPVTLMVPESSPTVNLLESGAPFLAIATDIGLIRSERVIFPVLPTTQAVRYSNPGWSGRVALAPLAWDLVASDRGLDSEFPSTDHPYRMADQPVRRRRPLGPSEGRAGGRLVKNRKKPARRPT